MKIVLIVGPSGAGKDSLLQAGKQAFAHRQDILFIPRYVTRMPDGNEQNYYVDQSAFLTLKQNGFFFIDWQAHGNLYGISLDPLLKKDKHAVIISVSRTVVPNFEQVFDDVETIVVSAPDAVLRKRLEARGRESAPAMNTRLARMDLEVMATRLTCFNNDGPLEQMASKFVEVLENILPGQTASTDEGETGMSLGSGCRGMHLGEN